MLAATEKALAAAESNTSKSANALEWIERLQTDAAALKTEGKSSDEALAEAENRIQKLRADLAANNLSAFRSAFSFAKTATIPLDQLLMRSGTDRLRLGGDPEFLPRLERLRKLLPSIATRMLQINTSADALYFIHSPLFSITESTQQHGGKKWKHCDV